MRHRSANAPARLRPGFRARNLPRRQVRPTRVATALALMVGAGVLSACTRAQPGSHVEHPSVALDPGARLQVVARAALPAGLHAVSCTMSGCRVGGDLDGRVFIWSEHGGNRQAEPVPDDAATLSAISCASARTCTAVGGGPSGFIPMFLRTSPDGTAWTAAGAWHSGGSLDAISCPTAQQCVAVGTVPLAVTTDGGATWTQGKVPDSTGRWNLQAVDCPTSQRCWAVGYQLFGELGGSGITSLIVSTSDGGATWEEQFPEGTGAELTAVSCTGDRTCVAAGTGDNAQPLLVHTQDAGATWSGMDLPAGIASIAAIDCTGPATCWIAGAAATPGSSATDAARSSGSIWTTSDGGASWTGAPHDTGGVAAYEALSCASAGTCTAVGSNQAETGGSVDTFAALASPGAVAGDPERADAALAPPGGRRVHVLVEGDSTALALGLGMLAANRSAETRVSYGGLVGCGVMGTAPQRSHGAVFGSGLPVCANWQDHYAQDVSLDHPDVVLFLTGRWEVHDRLTGGMWSRIGEPAFDGLLETDLRAAIRVLGASGASVVALSAPYYMSGTAPGGGLWPEDDPARVDTFNRLLASAVAASGPHARLYDLHSLLSPGGTFARVIDGIPVRTGDGAHFTIAGGVWLAGVLVPVARAAAQ